MSENGDFGEFIRTLKEKSDIIEVVSSYIKLERRGQNYWACCPFHHEKTPSFTVNALDKYYHCFGCGVSGDVIGFVKEYENLGFMQAVEVLAKRAGLEVPARDDKSAEENAAKKKKRDRLAALMKDAARFYLGNLRSGRAVRHMEYIAGRGLSPSVIKKFGLGASLDYTSLPAHLLAAGYTPEECTESGACVKTDDGKLIDAEGERLIIPIINHFDEVVAFGGRILKPTDRAKYKNTRETLLFEKSKNLFNINLVKKEKRAGALPNLIMVEGYMDAISLYGAGFHNVVASMGTSLTKEQARLCKRYADTVLISYDGDFAGQKANLRGLDILKGEGLRVRVVPMPEGLDPDDVVRERGEEGYRACLDAAMPLIDFRLLAAQKKYDLTRTDEVREFAAEALLIARDAESETEREELIKRISEVSGVSRTALVRDLENTPAAQEPSAAAPVPKEDGADREKKAARFVLAACLLSKPYAAGCDLEKFDFTDTTHRTVAGFITTARRSGTIRPSGIFDIMPGDDRELSEILNLDYGENLDGAQAKRYFADCVATLERGALSDKIAEERSRYASAETAEEKREILTRIAEYTKQLKNIGTGGNS